MYVAIVTHTPKRGATKGRPLYVLELSAYQGGTVWARSSDYQTVQAAERTAGDLFMEGLPWVPGKPGERTMYYAHVDCTPVERPVAGRPPRRKGRRDAL